MKAVLICPAERPALGELASRSPLATLPLFGRSVLEFWIETLVSRGARQIIVLAADRPNRVRDHIGTGRRWGVQVDVVPTASELTVAEARAKFRHRDTGRWLEEDVVLIDCLPGQPEIPVFESHAAWFSAQRAWMERAVTPDRIGVRQVLPGVWAGLRAEIAPTARLSAPCWIGDHARISAHAQIGPGAIIEDRVVVDEGARVVESAVGPDTYVGRFVSVERSIAHGATITNWQSGSFLHVPDAFLLADLSERVRQTHATGWAGRIAAAFTMALTAPVAAGFIALSLVRGETPLQLRLGLRPQHGTRRLRYDTFAYYELAGARTWLRRWPQFWSVVRGDMHWVGNRPLRPTQALTLANDFERLWLAAPVGLISLADAYGCPDGLGDEAIAHCTYYAVHAGRRLDWMIVARAFLRSAMVWPIRGIRRKEATVQLQDLVQKQEL